MSRRKKRWIAGVMLAALLFTGCSLPGLSGNKDKDVIITGGASAEMSVMADIVKQMVEYYIPDANTYIISNLSSSTLNHTAMVQGAANISSTRFTGTALTGELGLDPVKDPKEAYDICVKAFDEKFQQVWYPSYGFADTYVFLVTEAFARDHQIETVSDLEKYKGEVRVGCDTSWMNREGDGYPAFRQLYGFDLPNLYPMSSGLSYEALKNNELDVILGYSTDGRVKAYGLKLLEDDKRLFPPYDASCVAAKEILERYPKLDGVLRKLCGTISTEQMAEMTYLCDYEMIEPEVVARNFLKEHNYFE